MPDKSLYQQISNPRETYTDGYGQQRPVYEPKYVTALRKVYKETDRFLNGPSEEEYFKETGMHKPITGTAPNVALQAGTLFKVASQAPKTVTKVAKQWRRFSGDFKNWNQYLKDIIDFKTLPTNRSARISDLNARLKNLDSVLLKLNRSTMRKSSSAVKYEDAYLQKLLNEDYNKSYEQINNAQKQIKRQLELLNPNVEQPTLFKFGGILKRV